MQDDFLEYTAVRKKQGLYTLLYYMLWCVIVVFGIAAVISLVNITHFDIEAGARVFSFQPLILGVVFGGIAYLAFRLTDNCRVEYDYAFTNGSLDISKVMNEKKRRYLCALDTKEVIRCGPATGAAFQKTLREPGAKVHNWFVNREAKLYYFYFNKAGVKHVIVLELSDEFVSVIRSKNYLQRGAWTDADGRQSYGNGIS